MDASSRGDGERLSELAQAVLREPRSIPYRLDLAMALLEIGRRDEAIQLFRDVALSYAEDGLIIQAMAVCRGILEIDPEQGTVVTGEEDNAFDPAMFASPPAVTPPGATPPPGTTAPPAAGEGEGDSGCSAAPGASSGNGIAHFALALALVLARRFRRRFTSRASRP